MKRIFELLKEKDVSQYRLAKEIGASEGNVCDWKNGRAKPGAEALSKMAFFFGVTTDYLLGLSDNPSATSAPPQTCPLCDTFAKLSPLNQHKVAEFAQTRLDRQDFDAATVNKKLENV